MTPAFKRGHKRKWNPSSRTSGELIKRGLGVRIGDGKLGFGLERKVGGEK